MVINQWLPAAHGGDAVGDSARAIRDLLRNRGHEADIFALTIDADLSDEIRPFTDPAARRGDITVLHFAVPSPLTAALATVRGRRVVQYHNVTPAHFFAPYDADIFRIAAVAREELQTLAGRVDLALGDSEYNRRELEALGFSRTGVLPLVVDTGRLTNAPPRPALERVLDDGPTNILFVGRIAPNKKLEDHIRLAEHYKRYVDSDYRFVFVGRADAVPRYYATLLALLAEYDMPPGRFLFTGRLSDAELATCYRTASAYVSLSEHEGFCAPLVEAMATDVPILAFGAAAVPETLGGAGVCFTPKDLERAAEALGLLVYDDELRSAVIVGQRRRLADFSRARAARTLDGIIESLTA